MNSVLKAAAISIAGAVLVILLQVLFGASSDLIDEAERRQATRPTEEAAGSNRKLEVLRDTLTGCEYLADWQGRYITPRLLPTGKQRCTP